MIGLGLATLLLCVALLEIDEDLPPSHVELLRELRWHLVLAEAEKEGRPS